MELDQGYDDPMQIVREKLALAGCASDDMKVAIVEYGYFTVMESVERMSMARTKRLTGFSRRLKESDAVRATLPPAAVEIANYILGDRELSPAMALVVSTGMVLAATFMAPDEQNEQPHEEEDLGFVDE